MSYKILNLILYSDTPEYNKMYNILSKYLKQYHLDNLKFYFYCYKSSLDKEFEINDDILQIKGQETFVPGILEKTISAFQYSLNFEYDYLVRTNISTIVDWNKFSKILDTIDSTKNIIYGGTIMQLEWLDYLGGIVDDKYKHQKFISGTCILLSRPAIELISKSKDIDITIIDDVAIGVFLHPKYISELIDFSKYVKWNQEYSKDGIIYRNRTEDRSEDAKRMERICEQILYKKEIKNISMSSKYLQERNLTWKKYF